MTDLEMSKRVRQIVEKPSNYTLYVAFNIYEKPTGRLIKQTRVEYEKLAEKVTEYESAGDYEVEIVNYIIYTRKTDSIHTYSNIYGNTIDFEVLYKIQKALQGLE